MNAINFHPSSAQLAAERDPRPRHFLAGRIPVLVQYLSIVRRRKWVLVSSIAAMLVLGLLLTLLMTPQYTASTTIEIQRETRNFTNVEGAQTSNTTSAIDNEFYQTQYGLLQARSLADRVATELKLFDNPDFFTMFHSRKAKKWFEDGRLIPNASTRAARIREAGDVLLGKIKIEPGRLSRLVEIGFTSPDANLSRRIVDTWASQFIKMTLERNYDATAYARTFLENRLVQLRTRIDQAERQLVDYAAREGIVNLPASTPAAGEGGVTGERSIVADDLAALNRELARATAERIQAQSRLSSADSATTESLQNEAIARLRERRAELAADYAKLLAQFEPGYPPAVALKTQIDQIDRSIAREEGRVGQSLRETYRSSLAREQALRSQVGGLKTGVLDLRRRSIQYNIYERDVDTSRQLYDALLQRYKEIGVAGGVGVNNISIVDRAELPEKPSSPKPLLNMALALLAGVLLGSAVAFGLEQIDQGIADPSDVEKELNVPLLGTLPMLKGDNPVEELQDQKSFLTEAYLSLLTRLAFSTDHGVPRTLAITSTRPAEGKTTTSYAIARSVARTSRRVLLVDADMRSPSINGIFEIDNDKGFSNYLAGDDDIAGLIRPTRFENLSVMVAGPQPPSAPELLSSDRFARFIGEAARQFDHVVFDAPPVMGLADAPLIASQVEGAVFVVESRATQKGMAAVALERLRSVGVVLFGVALTKFDSKRAHYGYGYDYGYGYGEAAESRS